MSHLWNSHFPLPHSILTVFFPRLYVADFTTVITHKNICVLSSKRNEQGREKFDENQQI